MDQNNEDHLPKYRVRPRFKVETSFTPEALCDKIASALVAGESNCEGQVSAPNYATLSLPVDEQHYWSPQLSLTIESLENGSMLRGLYSPRPAVWTMFVFFYSIIGFVILILSIICLSYGMLDEYTPLVWLIPLLIIIFLSLYLVSFVGQRKGHDQMFILHEFLEHSLGIEIIDHS